MLSHIASDLITVYGTQVLAPLSSLRASIGTTFIIDPWFTLVVLIEFVSGFNSASNRLPYASAGDATGFCNKVRSTYKTPEQMSWQRQRRFGVAGPEAERVAMLWHNEQLDHFRRFAELPVLYRIDQGMNKTCVWFTDLRYVLPYMTPPFRYGLCQEKRETKWGINRLRN